MTSLPPPQFTPSSPGTVERYRLLKAAALRRTLRGSNDFRPSASRQIRTELLPLLGLCGWVSAQRAVRPVNDLPAPTPAKIAGRDRDATSSLELLGWFALEANLRRQALRRRQARPAATR